jgi:hypothetical protein
MVLFEKTVILQLVKIFPSFYGTRWFIAISTSAPNTGPYLQPDESSPRLLILFLYGPF